MPALMHLAEVMMPVILYSTLRMVWSLAQVGTARKSMSSFFIAALLHPTSTQIPFQIITEYCHMPKGAKLTRKNPSKKHKNPGDSGYSFISYPCSSSSRTLFSHHSTSGPCNRCDWPCRPSGICMVAIAGSTGSLYFFTATWWQRMPSWKRTWNLKN